MPCFLWLLPSIWSRAIRLFPYPVRHLDRVDSFVGIDGGDLANDSESIGQPGHTGQAERRSFFQRWNCKKSILTFIDSVQFVIRGNAKFVGLNALVQRLQHSGRAHRVEGIWLLELIRQTDFFHQRVISPELKIRYVVAAGKSFHRGNVIEPIDDIAQFLTGRSKHKWTARMACNFSHSGKTIANAAVGNSGACLR